MNGIPGRRDTAEPVPVCRARSLLPTRSGRHRAGLCVLLFTSLVAGQSLPTLAVGAIGGEPIAKGAPETIVLDAADWAAIHAERRSPMPTAAAVSDAGPPVLPLSEVIVDGAGDGVWALGQTYKARFDGSGFLYVPYFGADAPRSYPVRFAVARILVGGRAILVNRVARVIANDTLVSLDRGSVREDYRLGLREVEQTFVVDTDLAGDVVIEMQVESDLSEDPLTPGVQFAGDLGRVDYGTAYLVDGGRKVPITTDWTGNGLRLVVPGAMRGPGPVVIDPIVSTSTFSFAGRSGDSHLPDIAFDTTTDRYLMVWEYAFSATDHDIWSELRDGRGAAIANGLAAIDISLAFEGAPRVANVNVADRFVIVYEKRDVNASQGRSMLWVRMQNANSAVPPGGPFLISDPTVGVPGHNLAPDIGGDSGSGRHWCVAWTLQVSASESWIVARTFDVDGNATNALQTYVENSPNRVFANVSVSSSSGGGVWCLVYGHMFSSVDWDVYGASVNASANIVTKQLIDFSGHRDRYPSISSPNTTLPGAPLFMVTYERETAGQAQGLLVDSLLNRSAQLDLTGAFGIGAFWVRCESDGNRFVVTGGAATISVATLGVVGSSFQLHESPQALTGVPAFPRICSKGGSGGQLTDYGIAYVDTVSSPDVIRLTTYSGRQPGGLLGRRATGCGTPAISATGRPFLGEGVVYSLSNTGGGLSGVILGLPIPATGRYCAACTVGVDLSAPTAVFAGTLIPVTIPRDSSLVGLTLATQGFAPNGGPCIAGLAFSETIDMTIR